MCAPSPSMGMNQSNRGSGLRLMAGAYRGCAAAAGEPPCEEIPAHLPRGVDLPETMQRGSLSPLAPILVAAVLFLAAIGTPLPPPPHQAPSPPHAPPPPPPPP